MKSFYIFFKFSIIYPCFLTLSSGSPTVEVKKGPTFIGLTLKTEDKQKTFYSFRSIAYAMPPTGERRFKAPEPLPEYGSSMIKAYVESPSCGQSVIPFVTIGQEDCLYLSVYTPLIKCHTLLPVMVWIHGGFFEMGAHTYQTYHPDYFMNGNVVVVTVNYRLSIFGFLNTEDIESPGNYGLKDQMLAMKWTKKYIKYFCGNDSNITIFGESAGAISVSYLTQSPLAKGLFDRAILQSGTSICPWGLTRNPKSVAFGIGEMLSLNTTSSTTLLNELRKIRFEELISAALLYQLKMLLLQPTFDGFMFGPSIEPDHEGAVLTTPSHHNLLNGGYHKIPYIIGFNLGEAFPFTKIIGQYIHWYFDRVMAFPTALVPESMNIKNQFEKLLVNIKIKSYFFKHSSTDVNNIFNYFNDNEFVRPILESVNLYSENSDVYMYVFSYRGSFSTPITDDVNGMVGHGEELIYLFRNEYVPVTLNREDNVTRYRLLKLWTNFAKTGNPTPKKDDLLENVIWDRSKSINVAVSAVGCCSKKYGAGRLKKIIERDYQQPVVKIKSGMTIVGRINQTVEEHKTYYTFRAIPFALPPIGELRFKPPVALSSDLMDQIVNASEDSSTCFEDISTVGSEDCLYLNVYTPQFQKSSSLRPVMFWIYGGAFINGDDRYSSFGPDFLIDQDVIVVTTNYRLGIFGFLSTEDYASPGNYGLKDQIMALRWVQENIEYFGGNRSRVTLFGESAGSASVSYLSQSPLTEGLFQSAILESGTSINSWALARNGREIALLTAEALHVDTYSSQALVDGLRKVDAKKLQQAALASTLENALVYNPINGLPFAPTIEPIHPGAVVMNHSQNSLKNGFFHKIPYIIGFNSLEGIPFVNVLNYIRLYLVKYDLNPTMLVPAGLDVYDPVTKLNLGLLIKNYYFGTTPITISEESLLQYVSDDSFVRPILEATILYSQYAPVYLYKFSYQGSLGSGHRKQQGWCVGHAEELPYIWRIEGKHNKITTDDLLTRKRMVTLWTNFAKYGNPTPFPDVLFENVSWPLAHVNGFGLRYLDINLTLNASTDPNWKSFVFWTDLFKKPEVSSIQLSDNRLFVTFRLYGEEVSALVDTGSYRTYVGKKVKKVLTDHQVRPISGIGGGVVHLADGSPVETKDEFQFEIEYREVNGQGPHAAILVRVSDKSAHINDLVTKQRVSITKRRARSNNAIYRNFKEPLIPLFPQKSGSNPYFNNFKLDLNITPKSSRSSCGVPDVSTPSTSVNSNGAIPKLKFNSPPQMYRNTTTDLSNYLSDSSTDSDELHARLVPKVIPDKQLPPQNVNNNIPISVQNNLRTLMNTCDNELDYSEYGYKALIFLCLDLSDIFICVRPDKGDHKLFYKPKGIPKDYDKGLRKSICNQQDDDDKPSTEPPVLNLDEFMGKKWVYPEDVIHMHEEIPRQFMPSHVQQGDFVDVVIGEVYDPSKFWLLFHELYESLNNLMDEMQIFYTSYNTYIPSHMAAVGMYCVASYNSEFHRAVIVNAMINIPNKVKVYYIDYGTVGAVASDSLKFLHKKFCGLPQQAVRARLCGICPPTEKTQWSMEASSRFLELVHMRTLVAHVYHIDFERQILNIFLADTSGDDDIYLNDTLVNEGYAIFSNQEQQKINLEPRSTPWVKCIHLFPTFDEIEWSAVPSASEMCRLIKTGMPLELIYPRYFGPRKTNDQLLDDDVIHLTSPEQVENIPDNLEEENLSNSRCSLNADNHSPLMNKRNYIDEDVDSESGDFTDWGAIIEPTVSNKLKTSHNCELDPINEELINTNLVKEAVPPKYEPFITKAQTNSLDIPPNDLNSNGSEATSTYISDIVPNNSSECSEKINATPAIRPPPGFEKLQPSPSFTTTSIGLDNMKNQFVAQTTNGSSSIPNINLLNVALNQQLLLPVTSHNLHQSQSHIQQTQSYIFHQIPSHVIHQSHATVYQHAPPHVPFLNYAPTQQVVPPQFAFPLGQSNNPHFYGNSRIPDSQINYLNQINSYANPERTKIQMLICQKLIGKRELQEYFVQFLQNHQRSPSVASNKFLYDHLVWNLTHKPGLIVEGLHYNIIYCLVNSLNDMEICELFGAIETADCISSALQQLSLNTPTDLQNVKNKLPHSTVLPDDIHTRKERQLVIRAEMNGFSFHVIWYDQEPHIFMKELLNFLKIDAPVEGIKKRISFIEDEDVTIINLQLWKNTEIYNALSRYIQMDKNTLLPIIRTVSIPKIAPILQAVFLPGSEKIQFEQFLERINADSDLWFRSK
ncbi:hypothetical protein RI129_001386 [Pyrocoelia pectoralis]|uniref:Tudor domain-containing protein n=1 Tax=Pyrocoelia pectoralis TaxID=417401 RepID=A0AAN7ZSU4_9COLE